MIAIGFLSRSPATMSENLSGRNSVSEIVWTSQGLSRVGWEMGRWPSWVYYYCVRHMHDGLFGSPQYCMKNGCQAEEGWYIYMIHGCGLEGWLCIVCLVAWPAPCVENSGRSALLLLEHSAIPWHYICTHRIRLLLASLPSDARG